MPSLKENDRNAMATDVIAPGAGEPGEDKPRPSSQPPRAEAGGGGFFSIYKKGQGYWTRMGTAAAAILVAALTAQFLYQQVPIWLNAAGVAPQPARTAAIAIAAAFVVVFGGFVFWLMNKPSNADFLIATDGEMKKVNWTSRRELIGSTKVVIVFMFLIAGILFAIDVLFGYFFYLITVLHTKPF
jgi:preprotein translocase SecE subunit